MINSEGSLIVGLTAGPHVRPNCGMTGIDKALCPHQSRPGAINTYTEGTTRSLDRPQLSCK